MLAVFIVTPQTLVCAARWRWLIGGRSGGGFGSAGNWAVERAGSHRPWWVVDHSVVCSTGVLQPKDVHGEIAGEA